MLSTNNELYKLNCYFKSVMEMMPSGVSKSLYAVKRPAEEILTVSGRKANAKRQKLNPKNFQAINKFSEESSDGDDLMPKKKGKPIVKTGDCSIAELQDRLRQKIVDIKMQRESKKPPKKRVKSEKTKKMVKTKEKLPVASHTNFTEVETGNKLKKVEVSKSNPIKTKEGKIVYSKFDFGKMLGKSSEKSLGKKYKLPTGKDYKSILTRVLDDKEKLDQLKKDDPEKAAALMEKDSWKKAAAKAEGIKLKDDPALLKKSMKRKEALKKKSAKSWEERNKAVADKIQKKQEKRKANIKRKKDVRKQKKTMKLSKKKSRTPGF